MSAWCRQRVCLLCWCQHDVDSVSDCCVDVSMMSTACLFVVLMSAWCRNRRYWPGVTRLSLQWTSTLRQWSSTLQLWCWSVLCLFSFNFLSLNWSVRSDHFTRKLENVRIQEVDQSPGDGGKDLVMESCLLPVGLQRHISMEQIWTQSLESVTIDTWMLGKNSKYEIIVQSLW